MLHTPATGERWQVHKRERSQKNRSAPLIQPLDFFRARSLVEIARREGLANRYIMRLTKIAFVSPGLVDAIAEGVVATGTNLQILIGAGFCQDHRYRWYRDCGIGLYSPNVRNRGEQASVRKVAIPNVLEVLLMFLLQSVSICNSSPNPELELSRNNLLKRLFGWNTA